MHLLDDDLGCLSRGRDGDLSELLSTDGDYRDFVRALDAKNDRWVVAADGLSRRMVLDLLRWSGHQVDEYYASLDLAVPSGVIWASKGSVPRWFDMCRDLTERWVHQQHIRDAIGKPGEHHRFLPDVLADVRVGVPEPIPGRRTGRRHRTDRTRCRRGLASCSFS